MTDHIKRTRERLDIQRTPQNPKTSISKTTKKPKPKITKPKIDVNPFSHFQTLESYYEISQNKRYSPRDADAWTEKYHEHTKINSIGRFQG